MCCDICGASVELRCKPCGCSQQHVTPCTCVARVEGRPRAPRLPPDVHADGARRQRVRHRQAHHGFSVLPHVVQMPVRAQAPDLGHRVVVRPDDVRRRLRPPPHLQTAAIHRIRFEAAGAGCAQRPRTSVHGLVCRGRAASWWQEVGSRGLPSNSMSCTVHLCTLQAEAVSKGIMKGAGGRFSLVRPSPRQNTSRRLLARP